MQVLFGGLLSQDPSFMPFYLNVDMINVMRYGVKDDKMIVQVNTQLEDYVYEIPLEVINEEKALLNDANENIQEENVGFQFLLRQLRHLGLIDLVLNEDGGFLLNKKNLYLSYMMLLKGCEKDDATIEINDGFFRECPFGEAEMVGIELNVISRVYENGYTNFSLFMPMKEEWLDPSNGWDKITLLQDIIG